MLLQDSALCRSTDRFRGHADRDLRPTFGRSPVRLLGGSNQRAEARHRDVTVTSRGFFQFQRREGIRRNRAEPTRTSGVGAPNSEDIDGRGALEQHDRLVSDRRQTQGEGRLSCESTGHEDTFRRHTSPFPDNSLCRHQVTSTSYYAWDDSYVAL